MFPRNLPIFSKINWHKIAQYWGVWLLVKKLGVNFQAWKWIITKALPDRSHRQKLASSRQTWSTTNDCCLWRSHTQDLSPRDGHALSQIYIASPNTFIPRSLYLSPQAEVIFRDLCRAPLKGKNRENLKTFFPTWT